MLFCSGNEKININYASNGDVSKIYELYKHISITPKNYLTALNKGEKSFEHRGGMFEISLPEDIEKRINDKREKTIVGSYKDSICSMLWYGYWEPEVFEGLEVLKGNEKLAEVMEKAEKENKLGYSKEIISLVEGSKIMPFALFYKMMSDYVDEGIAYTVGEVFLVNGYEDKNGYKQVDLLNKASFNFLKKSGGIQIGAMPQKKVDLKGFSVYITPQVFIWDTNKSLYAIKNILSEKGWG